MIEANKLERTGLLSGLSTEHRAQALAAFNLYEFGPGEVLLEEGESDRSLLVVIDGALEVSLGGVPLTTIGPNELVGEMALFGSFDRRSATVSSTAPSTVAVLDQEGLRFLRLGDNPLARQLEGHALRTIASRLRSTDALIAARAAGAPIDHEGRKGLLGRIASVLGVGGEMPRGPAPRLVEILRAAHGFAGRDENVLHGVAARLQLVAVATGETILEEGKEAEDAYIVGEGQIGVFCSVSPGKQERVATLGPGHVFGVVAMSDTKARTATCRALTPAYLARIPGAVYRQLEQENSAEGRAFRRGLIDALSVQLRLANEHLLGLSRR